MANRNYRAEERYRTLWNLFRYELGSEERAELEYEMDTLQPSIADSPDDPKWIEFAASLPGYNDYWNTLVDRILQEHVKELRLEATRE